MPTSLESVLHDETQISLHCLTSSINLNIRTLYVREFWCEHGGINFHHKKLLFIRWWCPRHFVRSYYQLITRFQQLDILGPPSTSLLLAEYHQGRERFLSQLWHSQRLGKGAPNPPASLHNLPLVIEPFSQIAIDIVDLYLFVRTQVIVLFLRFLTYVLTTLKPYPWSNTLLRVLH